MSELYQVEPHVFNVVANVPHLVAIRAPYRGRINSIRLEQTGGVNCNAAFQLYSSADGARVANVDSISDTPPTGAPANYEIGPAMAKVGGTPFRLDDVEYPYVNQQGKMAQRDFHVYLVITSVGNAEFTFSMVVEMPYVG